MFTDPRGQYPGYQRPSPSPHAPWTHHPQSQPSSSPAMPQNSSTPGGAPSSSPTNLDDGLPEPPTSYPELEKLSTAELKALHEDSGKFEHFVASLDHQKQLNKVLEAANRNLEKVEKEHKEMTSRIDDAEDDNAVTKLESDIESVEKQVAELQEKKKKWMKQNSPLRLMERLNLAMNEECETSDALVKDMLSTSIDFDTFLTEYIESRKKYHQRKLKLDQLEIEQKQNVFMR